MGLHTELDIYKPAYELVDLAIDYVVNMPRPVKRSVGDRLIDLCMQMMLLILRINCIRNVRERVPHLEKLLECKEEIGLVLRLCRDKNYIGIKQHAAALERVISVGKQATAWKKSCTA